MQYFGFAVCKVICGHLVNLHIVLFEKQTFVGVPYDNTHKSVVFDVIHRSGALTVQCPLHFGVHLVHLPFFFSKKKWFSFFSFFCYDFFHRYPCASPHKIMVFFFNLGLYGTLNGSLPPLAKVTTEPDGSGINKCFIRQKHLIIERKWVEIGIRGH